MKPGTVAAYVARYPRPRHLAARLARAADDESRAFRRAFARGTLTRCSEQDAPAVQKNRAPVQEFFLMERFVLEIEETKTLPREGV